MQVWTSLASIPSPTTPAVVTIGNFDGVHRGHQEIITQLTSTAKAHGSRPVVVTFDPHPLAILNPAHAPGQLSTITRRTELLKALGVTETCVIPFTKELAAWTPEEFISRVLVDALGAQHVLVGCDFRFGAQGAGTVETLTRFDGGALTVHKNADIAGSAGRRWSSTWARELIADGDVSSARKVLGRWHEVCGEVVHGDHRGRELGYPTANVSAETMIPADGIYAGWLVNTSVSPDGVDYRLPAAVSVGTNPTFDGEERRCEAYVLDRNDLDLYGCQVRVEFVQRLRGTVKFDDVSDLLTQMAGDVAQCRNILTTTSMN